MIDREPIVYRQFLLRTKLLYNVPSCRAALNPSFGGKWLIFHVDLQTRQPSPDTLLVEVVAEVSPLLVVKVVVCSNPRFVEA